VSEPDASPAVDRATLARLLDTWGGFLDAGLPSLVFVCVYTFAGRRLAPALLIAVGVAVALAVIRLLRKDKVSSVITGVFGMAVSAVFAWRTGQPRNVFALGLLINAAFLVGYLVSVLVRWPVLGVLVGLARQDRRRWHADPVLVRGFSRATLIWVAMFAVRLLVQVPLYVTSQVGALGAVRVALGWPLTLATIVATFAVLKATVGPRRWTQLRDDLVKAFTGAVEPRTAADED
jgi:hypothetical protein